VVEWDERLTTVQAERDMGAIEVPRARRREVVDQMAAALILQAWLERQRAIRGDGEEVGP